MGSPEENFVQKRGMHKGTQKKNTKGDLARNQAAKRTEGENAMKK